MEREAGEKDARGLYVFNHITDVTRKNKCFSYIFSF